MEQLTRKQGEYYNCDVTHILGHLFALHKTQNIGRTPVVEGLAVGRNIGESGEVSATI
jgi:hypothetical protein